MRTGHSTLPRAQRHRYGLEEQPTCLECGEAPEDAAHLLTECPARARLRWEVFGRDDPDIKEALGDTRLLADFLGRLRRP